MSGLLSAINSSNKLNKGQDNQRAIGREASGSIKANIRMTA